MNAVAIRDILERSTVSPYREMVAFEYLYSLEGMTLKKIADLTIKRNLLPSQAVEELTGLFDAEGPFRTSGFSAGLAHLESVGIAKKQRVSGVFTPTWALTREAMSALAEDDGLRATVAGALGRGLRDREAEESIASVIRRAPAATAGAISFMFDKGHFDYRAPDDDPWEARMDQGNRELSEMESYGVIQYETLASGERRWTLTKSARRAIESDESLIGEGRSYVRAALEGGADEDEESA